VDEESDSPSGPQVWPRQTPPPGRGGWVISQLYYYLVAAGGIGLLVAGGVGVAMGVRQIITPGSFESRHNGLYHLLQSLGLLIPGAVAAVWHVREARRREGVRFSSIPWPRALYYMLASLFAVAFVYLGSVTFLRSVATAIYQQCGIGPGGFAVPLPAGPLPIVRPHIFGGPCYPGHLDSLRQAVSAVLVTVVAGAVWLWHLAQLRRETAP